MRPEDIMDGTRGKKILSWMVPDGFMDGTR